MVKGVEVAGESTLTFGGAALVFLGAIVAYFAFAAIEAHMR